MKHDLILGSIIGLIVALVIAVWPVMFPATVAPKSWPALTEWVKPSPPTPPAPSRASDAPPRLMTTPQPDIQLVCRQESQPALGIAEVLVSLQCNVKR